MFKETKRLRMSKHGQMSISCVKNLYLRMAYFILFVSKCAISASDPLFGFFSFGLFNLQLTAEILSDIDQIIMQGCNVYRNNTFCTLLFLYKLRTYYLGFFQT